MNTQSILLFILLSTMSIAAQGVVKESREFGFWTWLLMVAFSISAVLLTWWGRSKANRF